MTSAEILSSQVQNHQRTAQEATQLILFTIILY